jgi:hypothetical protein
VKAVTSGDVAVPGRPVRLDARSSGRAAIEQSLAAAAGLLEELGRDGDLRSRVRALLRFASEAPLLLRGLGAGTSTGSPAPLLPSTVPPSALPPSALPPYEVPSSAVPPVVLELEAAVSSLPDRWHRLRSELLGALRTDRLVQVVDPAAVRPWGPEEESVFTVSVRWPDVVIRGFVEAFRVSDETFSLHVDAFAGSVLVPVAVVRAPRWAHLVLLRRSGRVDDPCAHVGGVVDKGAAEVSGQTLDAAMVLWTPSDPSGAFYDLGAAVAAVRMLDGSVG